MDKSIEEAINKSLENVSLEHKDEMKNALREFIENNKPIYKSLGIDEEIMKFTYATGYNAFHAGKYSDALAAFNTLYTFDPQEPKYTFGRALCYKEMGKYVNAINEFQRYTMLKPDDPQCYWLMYECFQALNEPWGAGAALGAVIQICSRFRKDDELLQRAEMALIGLTQELKRDEVQK